MKREIKDFALEQAKGKRSFPSHILHDMNSHLSPSLFFTFLHFSSFDFLSCLYKKFLWNWKKARCVLYRKRLLIQKKKNERDDVWMGRICTRTGKGKGKMMNWRKITSISISIFLVIKNDGNVKKRERKEMVFELQDFALKQAKGKLSFRISYYEWHELKSISISILFFLFFISFLCSLLCFVNKWISYRKCFRWRVQLAFF